MPLSSVLSLVDLASTSYSAGPGVEDAIRIHRELAEQGMASTVCYWDDGRESPPEIASICSRLLWGMNLAVRPESYLSVKLPALDFNPQLLKLVAERAQQKGTGVHVDALKHEDAERTFTLLERMSDHLGHVGVTLPGRWQRSVEDASRVIRFANRVRVVKGQWADPGDPSRDLRQGFLEVVEALAGHARCVAVATHDADLAAEAVALLKEGGTDCEIELLYGLPMRACQQYARAHDIPVRIYVPCGHRWLPYRLREIPHRPQVAAWFVRDVLHGAVRLAAGSLP